MSADGYQFTPAQLLHEVEVEVANRRLIYAERVARGKMPAASANRRIAAMEAVAAIVREKCEGTAPAKETSR